MKKHNCLLIIGVCGFALGAFAQRSPSVGFIYPAGGRQGTTFTAALSGQFLDGVTNVVVSGDGVQASVTDYVRPLNGRLLNLLRDRQRNMQKGLNQARKTDTIISFVSEFNTNTIEKLERSVLEKELEEIRKKLKNPKNQRPPWPQLAEDVKLRVTISANATPGERELRMETAAGLSNPLIFHVGLLPEVTEIEPKSNPTEIGTSITLPTVINGQILAGDVDRFKFRARQGERLVMVVKARELMPYIADAVPGWFQATLALLDAKGKEVAYDDDFRFNPDPVLYYEIPRDGEYTLEIKDSIYRGREDFVYRITVGDLPYITGIFPLGGRVGAQTAIELKGWNLGASNLLTDFKATQPGIYPIIVSKGGREANHMPFALDTLPETSEREPNQSSAVAQAVTLPIIVNGRIDKPGDEDVFRFEAPTGGEIVAEVMARRLNSPLDSLLRITDATGKQLAINDDFEDRGSGLTTHHADSRLQITLPAGGTYYLHLTDTQRKGGSEYAYRLRISPPQPDFELRAVPASLNARAGATVPVTVHVLRKDGFNGDIAISLKDAPTGFRLTGKVPGSTNQARLTLTAPPTPPKDPVSLQIEGRATIGGREVARQAVPAVDMMQAFAYRHLVPAQELLASVYGRGVKVPNQAKGFKKAVKKSPATN